jgi:hypothetical protein
MRARCGGVNLDRTFLRLVQVSTCKGTFQAMKPSQPPMITPSPSPRRYTSLSIMLELAFSNFIRLSYTPKIF